MNQDNVFSLEIPVLLRHHLQQLHHGSGISEEDL